NGTGTSAVTEGWTGKSVAVETGSFDLPNGLAAGATKDIVTASAGFFSDDKIEGSRKYTEKALKDTQDGVVLAYSQTSGVKAEDNGAKLAYHALKNTGSALTLGEVAAFEQDGTAATYGKDFDLTGASINADGLSFKTGLDDAASGTPMTVVDASEAVKNEKGDSLQGFEDETFENTFDNEVKDALTLAGTRTDTLSQDDAKTKLTYTVGERVVDTATFKGTIAWNEGDAYYRNADYTFSGKTAINAKDLTFDKVEDAVAVGDSMTLVAAEGIKAGNEVMQPTAGDINVAYTDGNGIAFEATAEGEVKAADGSFNYEVTGVGLNQLDLAGWKGSAASDVPDGWALAENATVKTDGMAVPEVKAGKHIDILQANAAGFFDGAKINGANAYKTEAFTESNPSKSVTVAGSQGKGVTLNKEKDHLIYAVGTKDVDKVTLGKMDWEKDATLLDRSSDAYNYTGAGLDGSSFAMNYREESDVKNVAAGDTMTLLKANGTLNLSTESEKTNSYSYEPVAGVTVNGTITGKLA
ncbi:MAG: hypothetical protein J5492_02605, partial [Oxalobacter sp.]|nr:hypothetical protein [Oxalobacter sp.]